MKAMWCQVSVIAILGALVGPLTMVWADESRSTTDGKEKQSACLPGRDSRCTGNDLQGIQVETSDVKTYEQFFSQALRAPEVERVDHPERDSQVSRAFVVHDR